MKKHIKDKIIDELVKGLKKSEKTESLKKRKELSTANRDLKKTFELLEKLPTKKLNDCFVVPIGRLMNNSCSDYDLSDLTYFYFLVIEKDKVNLHMCDLKEIDRISEINVNAAFYEKRKYDRLVDWVSELQNHPDFLFEDLEKMKELLKVNFLSKNQSLC